MKIKKFNEGWANEVENAQEQSEIEAVSNVLNDTDAYNKIAKVLNIEIDTNSIIFNEIEDFIVTMFKEMRDTNTEEGPNDGHDPLEEGPNDEY